VSEQGDASDGSARQPIQR